MRMRKEGLTENGKTTYKEIPWDRFDYQQAIEDIECQITPRRLREAMLSEAGDAWLKARNEEIRVLREEMAAT